MESRYKVVYTLQYHDGFIGVADYYVEKFGNRDLIIHLENEIIKREALLQNFPYSFTIFESNQLLKHEYRTFNVLNYKVFYYIDELAKIVYIRRILQAKIDFKNIGL